MSLHGICRLGRCRQQGRLLGKRSGRPESGETTRSANSFMSWKTILSRWTPTAPARVSSRRCFDHPKGPGRGLGHEEPLQENHRELLSARRSRKPISQTRLARSRATVDEDGHYAFAVAL